MAPRRKFSRPLGERRYKKLFVLAVEGIRTEPQYCSLYNSQGSVIRVQCLKGKSDSSPPQVLKRMEKHLKAEELKKSDEVWIVADKDQRNQFVKKVLEFPVVYHCLDRRKL